MTEHPAQGQDTTSDDMAQMIREHGEAMAKLRAQLDQQASETRAAKLQAAAAAKEIADLKNQLIYARLLAERLRGYIEGRASTEPPRMVPEPRSTPYWMSQEPYGAPDFSPPRPWGAP